MSDDRTDAFLDKMIEALAIFIPLFFLALSTFSSGFSLATGLLKLQPHIMEKMLWAVGGSSISLVLCIIARGIRSEWKIPKTTYSIKQCLALVSAILFLLSLILFINELRSMLIIVNRGQ